MTRSTLVTGAASGIGKRLAELLEARGDRVTRLDLALGSDVRDAAAVQRAVDEVQPRLVINSAGIQLAKPFPELTEAEFRRLIEVNLVGSRNVAAAAWPHLRDGGHLVLIASLAGLVPNYGYAAYCASKYGAVGLAEVLRLEGRPAGIAVSCVCPPEVMTPMVEEERRTMTAPARALKELAGSMPLEPAAQAILKGIDRRDFMIVPSAKAKGARLLGRVLPARMGHAITDRVVARNLR